MGKIIISDNVSLGEVTQNPAGDEGSRPGGWASRPATREHTAQVLLDEALGTQALLFGRGWRHRARTAGGRLGRGRSVRSAGPG